MGANPPQIQVPKSTTPHLVVAPSTPSAAIPLVSTAPDSPTPSAQLAAINPAHYAKVHFEQILSTLRTVTLRREVEYEELPAPTKLAPFAWAISADVIEGDDNELANGRFVLLHDPDGQEAWGGQYRVVTYVRSYVDAFMSGDELAHVGWSWVRQELASLKTHATHPTCTITEVRSTSFGEVDSENSTDSEPTVEIEMRASWSPVKGEHLEEHLLAWSRIMCAFAALPPESLTLVTIQRKTLN